MRSLPASLVVALVFDVSSLSEPTVEYDKEACRHFDQLHDVP